MAMKTCGRFQVPIMDLKKVIESLGGRVDENPGGDHPFKAKYEGIRPCPLGKTTDYQKHVVPWMRHAFKEAYSSEYVKNLLGVRYA
ncbi:MAG: hypothetical protein Q8N77_04115 [Nanoarchaeota archaeon]|nr:hypothetical protein [Nanoarchaeota archaeon]